MEFFSKELECKIKNAPLLPGCYLYKDTAGGILYIGKAIQLRDRVKNYFIPDFKKNFDLSLRIQKMVKQIRDVEFITVDSEAEALVLETNLIHKYHPKYNIDKKDDKNYQWLKFLKKEDFPRPLLVRAKIYDNAKYFGPYPNSLPLKRTLKYLRKVFPYRTCNRRIIQIKDNTGQRTLDSKKHLHTATKSKYHIKTSDAKPCLYYLLGLCPAPCASKIFKKEYSANISHIKEYFANKKENLIYKLKEEMAILAKGQRYEEAAIMRDKISDFLYIAQRIEVENNININEEQFVARRGHTKVVALNQLIEVINDENLKFISNLKIECYDISNIGGKQAVGSMVAFVNGVPAKNLYRKFRLKLKETPDDYAMMQEVFFRRFSEKNLRGKDKSFSQLPNLIIVDGGKGQLSSTFKVLQELSVNIPIIGLAKQYEDIYTISGEKGELSFTKKILKEGTEARFLMQRIRDEAHRFGIAYHRNLRLKVQRFSVLSTVPGVGKVIGVKLLRAFGSLGKIKSATTLELYSIVKNKKTVSSIQSILQ